MELKIRKIKNWFEELKQAVCSCYVVDVIKSH